MSMQMTFAHVSALAQVSASIYSTGMFIMSNTSQMMERHLWNSANFCYSLRQEEFLCI